MKGNSAEFYQERAKKDANTPCKSIYAKSTKNSINRMKKQWENSELIYIENEIRSNRSLDFVLSLRLPFSLKFALLKTLKISFISF